MNRLVEVLLIEALRADANDSRPPGLLRGLSEGRIAGAIRAMHAEPARAWTVVQLAKTAGLSRSVFFDRFKSSLGVTPMDYLLAWRMALAKDLLRKRGIAADAVAQRVGYASASTFSTAFSNVLVKRRSDTPEKTCWPIESAAETELVPLRPVASDYVAARLPLGADF